MGRIHITTARWEFGGWPVLRSLRGIEGTHGLMARAGLGLTVRQLSEITGLDKSTIVRFEAGMKLKEGTVEKIQKALEEGGAVFCVSNDGSLTWVGVPRHGDELPRSVGPTGK